MLNTSLKTKNRKYIFFKHSETKDSDKMNISGPSLVSVSAETLLSKYNMQKAHTAVHKEQSRKQIHVKREPALPCHCWGMTQNVLTASFSVTRHRVAAELQHKQGAGVTVCFTATE